MAQIPGTPKLESRNCPETVPGGVSGLWELITPDCKLGLRRGLNQSCSPRRDLSNGVSHFQFGLREEVDSLLLVVASQIASLTPGPSFAHNLGDRCPNAQCKGIFDIYASRPFQWHQEHPNVRCFGSCCWALNIRESRRTPNPQLFQVLGFTPTLGQVRVATPRVFQLCINHLVWVVCRPVWVSEACHLFLVPSWNSNMPFYLSKCCELGSVAWLFPLLLSFT
jgi:hypothetical protein